MDISILNKISKFVKENNINIDGIYYKFPSKFPEAFHRTVNNYLKRAYSKYGIKGKIDEFFIGFDENKNAYLEFVGKIEDPSNAGEFYKVKEVRVLVFEDNIRYDFTCPPSLIIKEGEFLENIKYLDNALYFNTHANLPVEFTDRFFREYLEGKGIEEYFNDLSNDIINYINYLNNQSKLSYQILEEEIKEAKEIEKIYFMESESSNNSSRVRKTTQSTQNERKYDEIPFEERKDVLDSYPSTETFEARSTNTTAAYYVKAFKIKEKCKLVMEPIEGNKYTKVVHLDSIDFSKSTIREIVIDSLELSRAETTNTKEITRHSHTTIEEYKNLLEYLLNQNNTGISYGTKARIDEASETKIR